MLAAGMTARSELNDHFTPLTASRVVPAAAEQSHKCSAHHQASPGPPASHPRAHATADSAQAGSNPRSCVACTLRPASH